MGWEHTQGFVWVSVSWGLPAGWFLEEGGIGNWPDLTPPAQIPTAGAVHALGPTGNRWRLVRH